MRQMITNLINTLKEMGELEPVKDIHVVLASFGRHVEILNRIEAAGLTLRHTMKHDEYKVYIEKLNKDYQEAYSSASANVQILNRYCKSAKLEPIYKGSAENTKEISEFVINIVKSLCEARIV